MGSWSHLITREFETFKSFEVVARPESATPATGFANCHLKEQEDILEKSFKK